MVAGAWWCVSMVVRWCIYAGSGGGDVCGDSDSVTVSMEVWWCCVVVFVVVFWWVVVVMVGVVRVVCVEVGVVF